MQRVHWPVLTIALLTSLAVAIPVLASQGAGNAAAHPTHKPKPTATPRPSATPAPSPSVSASQPPLPAFGHVFVIVMENEESSAIIGNSSAPYINSLASQYGLATNDTAVSHPSEPNYLALWSGSTQGVTDDGVYNFAGGTTLGDQIEASGRSWHVAAENVPISSCYAGATASGGEDGTGTYARKHEPAISWTSVSANATRCARITDFSHFDPTLGQYWFIAPNLCHDMHDCSIATGDAWLQGWLPRILTSPAFADSVVFLTWDEGTTTTGGGGKVATIVISPLAKSGFSSATAHTHYSLVHTIQLAWGLPCLANTCAANDLREFFR
ncbi:MAG TPA: alkaline phosphatase family protein [Candidatus Limnocylindrales bacterium]